MHKKVAFIGSVGSGKTTIINQLSKFDTISTDVKSSVDIGKEMTTVGIDYGQINLDSSTSIGLYGVPGQRKYSMLWDFVKEGLWGIVILVKNGSSESLGEIEHLLEYFEVNSDIPCVVGVTHTDFGEPRSFIESIKNLLDPLGLSLPIYSIDARNESGALLLMQTLVAIDENS